MEKAFLMVDIDGLELTDEDRRVLSDPRVWGLILFSRNYRDKKQLLSLTNSIKKLRSDIKIAVDHEGGRVQRFRDGFTEVPPMRYFGKLYKKNRNRARSELERMAITVAQELAAMKIDINFAPVVDIDYGVSEVIGDRSFSDDPEIIGELAGLYIDTLQKHGVSAVAKHFPGHGAVAPDTHKALAHDDRDFATIERHDLKPFVDAIAHNVYGIMPSHVIYDKVDNLAAGFSKIWIQDILRNKLGFEGVIFSDDLAMRATAVVGDMVARIQAARDAGCDVVLPCFAREQVLRFLSD